MNEVPALLSMPHHLDQLRSLTWPQRSDLLQPTPTSCQLAKGSLGAENTEQSAVLTAFLTDVQNLTYTTPVPCQVAQPQGLLMLPSSHFRPCPLTFQAQNVSEKHSETLLSLPPPGSLYLSVDTLSVRDWWKTFVTV